MKMPLTVFALVAASFANIYITQPVLPVLQKEFGVDLVRVSFTISAVILGIAVSNLFFGALSDRLSIRPIIGWGGMAVALGGIVCAITHNVWVLIAARFVQGLFIPALTTCLAAYLAKTMPPTQLNVVMGSYVAATVLGGLGGRLLGGFIHPRPSTGATPSYRRRPLLAPPRCLPSGCCRPAPSPCMRPQRRQPVIAPA
jgi:YNFM family putative membrane transporter